MVARNKVEAGAVTHRVPALDTAGEALLVEATAAADALAAHLKSLILQGDADEQAAWLESSAAAPLFQPWAMEILYATGLHETMRFSVLERLLGISPRTLSARLRDLQDGGFLTRQVHDETPVRVTYTLSEHGRRAIIGAIPLVVYLHQHRASAGRG